MTNSSSENSLIVGNVLKFWTKYSFLSLPTTHKQKIKCVISFLEMYTRLQCHGDSNVNVGI